MKGFPKNLNTKADYMYVKANFHKSLWKPEFEKLLETTHMWIEDKELGENEVAQLGDNYKVVEIQKEGSEETIRVQFKNIPNPNCKMKRLGFTEKEIKKFLAE